jgi:hypothetical protein
MSKVMGNQPDLFHGQGNSTVKMPCKVTKLAGQTDPQQKKPGKLLKTKKVIQPGANK